MTSPENPKPASSKAELKNAPQTIVNQYFFAPVDNVAGHDVKGAPVPRVKTIEAPVAEPQVVLLKQGEVNYLELAKEEVPEVVWGQLEKIAKLGDVTKKELWLACKKKALICKHGKLVRQLVWVDHAVGGYGIFLVLTMLLLCFLAIVNADISKLLWWQQGLLLAYITVNAGLAFAVDSLYFRPHRTGRLAMMALRSNGNE